MSRFSFPSFVFGFVADTATHQIENGTIQEDGVTFVLTMLRNKQYNFLPFGIAAVAVDGKPVWAFNNHKKQTGFDGVALLAKAGEATVIALVGRGREGKVEQVIPLSSFASASPVGMKALLDMKMKAGVFLGRGFQLTELEANLWQIGEERRKAAERALAHAVAAKAAEEQLAVDGASSARETVRLERVNKLLARQSVEGWTATGQHRSGVPVVASEWVSLPGGTKAIIVSSYDEKVGVAGELVEAFVVIKKRGMDPAKRFAMPVSALAAPRSVVGGVTPQSDMPQPVGNIFVERNGDGFKVFLYESKEVIREARAHGLNGGTWVAVDGSEDSTGRIQVYAAYQDRMDTVGLCKML